MLRLWQRVQWELNYLEIRAKNAGCWRANKACPFAS